MKNKSTFHLLKTLALAIIIQVVAIQTLVGQSKSENIDKLLSAYSDYGQFNGSALVAENGKIIFEKGFGMANMEWSIPNQPDTKHRLGSITKQFTAMLILQLMEKGKLKLDAPITTYLPDYPKANGDQITIHHLLTHTAGIPNYTSFPNFFNELSRNPATPEEFVKVFSEMPLEFKPGEKFSYSNSGYFVLGAIIEKVSGKSYEVCLQENILTPLKMNNTGYDHSNTIIKNRASGYEKSGENFTNTSYIDMSLPYAAGSMYATVGDLFLWNQALYTDQLITPKSKELLFGNHIASGGGFYAYGWQVAEFPGGKDGAQIKITQHSGGINGFNTIITRIVTDKNLIVLLNNTGSVSLGKMDYAIRNILYDKPYDMPKKSAAVTLVKTIGAKGLDAALSEFITLKKSAVYAVDEGEMNSAGYQLLQTGKIKEAIAVFKLNTESFPKSGNTYDSLGEAYLASGDKKLAIENYKKSVALDPTNENGKHILSTLLK